MKVYIKPWEEALKSAKEFDKRLVDTVDGIDFILGILPRGVDCIAKEVKYLYLL